VPTDDGPIDDGDNVRNRFVAAAVAVLSLVALAAACGQKDNDTPTAPGVSRAEPTGTVNTTVPAATTTR
jgi:hypothetical protein